MNAQAPRSISSLSSDTKPERMSIIASDTHITCIVIFSKKTHTGKYPAHPKEI